MPQHQRAFRPREEALDLPVPVKGTHISGQTRSSVSCITVYIASVSTEEPGQAHCPRAWSVNRGKMFPRGGRLYTQSLQGLCLAALSFRSIIFLFVKVAAQTGFQLRLVASVRSFDRKRNIYAGWRLEARPTSFLQPPPSRTLPARWWSPGTEYRETSYCIHI